MKIWKRVVLAVLAIAILASFAACQVSKAPAETEKSTKPAKTTKQTTKATTTETTTKEASTTTFAADTAATEPAATEPVEQPMPEEGNTQSTGAAIGEMLQARFENIPKIELPEIALDELYDNLINRIACTENVAGFFHFYRQQNFCEFFGTCVHTYFVENINR